jgi:hypothetical protein
MAPEIVCGEAEPSAATDCYSLAVLLFYMFFISNPLEGKRESSIEKFDYAAEKKMYGTDPVFIFDPVDDSNRPDPHLHKNAFIFWEIYPQFFRDMFTRAFTAGLKDPDQGRLKETEWREGLIRLRDSIIYCQHCNAENFFDNDRVVKLGSPLPTCWNCKNSIMLPPMMRIGDFIINLNYNTKIYQYHLDRVSYDLPAPVGQVNQHPLNSNIWGLKNLSKKIWYAIRQDGSETRVPPQQSITLQSGLEIRFGEKIGIVDSCNPDENT